MHSWEAHSTSAKISFRQNQVQNAITQLKLQPWSPFRGFPPNINHRHEIGISSFKEYIDLAFGVNKGGRKHLKDLLNVFLLNQRKNSIQEFHQLPADSSLDSRNQNPQGICIQGPHSGQSRPGKPGERSYHYTPSERSPHKQRQAGSNA
ncbi:hypothetical protein Nepgr_005260 [Nepenthes gracilis]|uniref:Uncharacterized protein n=1 Tax=Nepenthes gracilis TaxID=150966 RepID=A0AAD3XGF1_NEPGR|nr:hypothetical protein Nepgr_005260 [Nepenthes gracilis]